MHALLEAMDLAAELDLPDLVVHAGHVAFYLGDDDAAYRFNSRTVADARATGAISDLLFGLQRLTLAEIVTGRWTAAQVSAAEAERLSRETSQPGLRAVPLGWLTVLAALTGDEERFHSLLTETEELAATHALGVFDDLVRDALHWARGLRELTMGNPESAVTWFSVMSHPAVAGMAAALDRIEAAIHSGGVRRRCNGWTDSTPLRHTRASFPHRPESRTAGRSWQRVRPRTASSRRRSDCMLDRDDRSSAPALSLPTVSSCGVAAGASTHDRTFKRPSTPSNSSTQVRGRTGPDSSCALPAGPRADAIRRRCCS